MIILTIRTDRPEAELGLYEDKKQLDYVKWLAHQELSSTIHKKINEILSHRRKILDLSSISYRASKSRQVQLLDIEGIVVYKGPGSFTGLRIGLSVANALAYSLGIPIVATSGKSWLDSGVKSLLAGKNDKVTLPEYDRPANTTKPRK